MKREKEQQKTILRIFHEKSFFSEAVCELAEIKFGFSPSTFALILEGAVANKSTYARLKRVVEG